MYYATLAQVRAEIDMQAASSGEASEAINDAYVLEALRVTTERFQKRLKPRDFLPRKETRYFDALGHHIDDIEGVLILSNPDGTHPLLAVTGVVDGEDTALVLNTDYRMYPRNASPAFSLRLITNGESWSKFSDDWMEAIEVTGTWGYHSRYAEAWRDSGDTVENDPLSSSGTSVTVNAVVLGSGLARFSAGQLIQIENEWLEVTATDAETNTLTVRRGARGTTAAAHNQNTAIYIFQVEGAINRAAWRYAAFLYARRGAFDRSRFDGVAAVEFPDDMPGEIENILDEYSNKDWATP